MGAPLCPVARQTRSTNACGAYSRMGRLVTQMVRHGHAVSPIRGTACVGAPLPASLPCKRLGRAAACDGGGEGGWLLVMIVHIDLVPELASARGAEQQQHYSRMGRLRGAEIRIARVGAFAE